MKMGKLEKFFVNRPGHSRRVSQHATKLLEFTNAREGQNYLDVGCGNGTAAIHISPTLAKDRTISTSAVATALRRFT
jgi:ubiquinone/menaquinone biosynthesis C-methylase UbiE